MITNRNEGVTAEKKIERKAALTRRRHEGESYFQTKWRTGQLYLPFPFYLKSPYIDVIELA